MGIYKVLTDYLPEIQHCSYGEWVVDRESKGTVQDPIQMPYVSYSGMVRRFQNDVYDFIDDHPEYELNNYQKVLEANNIQWGTKSMQTAGITLLDGKCIMALIVGAVRAERFSDGALLNFFESGAIEKWLLRLKEVDN